VKAQQILLFGGLALLAVVLMSAGNTSGIDLSGLGDAGAISRLQGVLNALASQGATTQQLKFMAAQMLQETGLLTDNPNYHATDTLLNYAGISSNGSLRGYNSLSDFATDYISVLSQGPNYPIQASSISDFNTRLKANGYYTDSAVTYGNNLNYYYNLLG
jgi:hypothetical protein